MLFGGSAVVFEPLLALARPRGVGFAADGALERALVVVRGVVRPASETYLDVRGRTNVRSVSHALAHVADLFCGLVGVALGLPSVVVDVLWNYVRAER